MEDREWSVYRHTFPDGKVYIGITSVKPEHRWNGGRGYKMHNKLQSAIEKYGWDNITHEVLFSGLSEAEARTKEQELIMENDIPGSVGTYNTHFANHKKQHADGDDDVITNESLRLRRYLYGLPDAFYERFYEKYGVAMPPVLMLYENRVEFEIWRKTNTGTAILTMAAAYPKDKMTYNEVKQWLADHDDGAVVVNRVFIDDEWVRASDEMWQLSRSTPLSAVE